MSRRNANTTKVFVGRLPAAATTDDLRRLFAPYGKIVECDIANNCGFLHLEDRELAMKAIQELDNTTLLGTRISVEKGRVKPPRNRGREGGGPMRGGRDRGGPYSRDSFERGPQRNGMGGYGREYPPYDERYGDYDRGMPPRGSYGSDYRGGGDGRPPFDDRRGYRPYGGPPNGYEDAYDDRRMPPGPSGGPGGYDDHRGPAPMGERRPLLDPQGPTSRATSGGYDRGNEMFSRRESKPVAPAAGGYGDRDSMSRGSYGPSSGSYGPTMGYSGTAAASGYGSGTSPGGYGGTSGYGSTATGSYGPTSPGTGTGYGTAAGYSDPAYGDTRAPPATGYGDSKAIGGGTGGYTDTRGGSTTPVGGYGATSGPTGYGDGYTRSGNYETAYPLPTQRSYPTISGAPGGPGRRY